MCGKLVSHLSRIILSCLFYQPVFSFCLLLSKEQSYLILEKSSQCKCQSVRIKGINWAGPNQHAVFIAAHCHGQGLWAELLQRHKSCQKKTLLQIYWLSVVKVQLWLWGLQFSPFPPLIRSLLRVCEDTEHPPLQAISAAYKYSNLLINICPTQHPFFAFQNERNGSVS